MAGAAQQPLDLQTTPITASQFLHIWDHFDSDGNGYIEEKELESFFKELEVAWRGDPSNPMLKERVKDFVQQFDKNKDGRIEMSELAEILPNEENFLLCFRQFVKSGTEFMKVSRVRVGVRVIGLGLGLGVRGLGLGVRVGLGSGVRGLGLGL
uniref:Calbindin 2a n=1 Tax=Takifugu rubripes TaxID=31033 RepID=A0A674P3U4_TAKRU